MWGVEMRKLPIGIQNFEKLIKENFLYVDKTDYIFRLVQNNVPYFLSRPRRFGKSLLLSTLKAYWEGKSDLFRGLMIEELEKANPDAWKSYPVFYFDFNRENYQNKRSLENILDIHLREWETVYKIDNKETSLAVRFQNLLKQAKKATGLRCVVLIDEYDKPLLDVLDQTELSDYNKAVFKGFFSSLKSFDEYLQFVFITGVTKFNKISIFSDLNQLNDISLNEEFSGICGITEAEIKKVFLSEMQLLSEKQKISIDECLQLLIKRYDGYHFHPEGVGVFNPFSLLKAFYERDFGSYWFETGTPTFLVKKLKETAFDIRKFTDGTLYASDGMLSDYRANSSNLIPLLYQTGYLTLRDFDKIGREYTLGFPNEEVKYGFLENLMPEYVPDCVVGSGKDIFTLRRYIERGETDRIRDVLMSLFAGIPYDINNSPFEHYFQTVIYLVFTLLNKFVICEMHTYSGRIDCIVETNAYVYLFEFKRDDSAEAAIKQIRSQDYVLPYLADSRKMFVIGAGFDSEKRMLVEWKVEGR